MQDQHAAEMAVAAKTVVSVGAAAAAAGNTIADIAIASAVALIAAVASLHFERPAKGTEVVQILLRLFAYAVVGVLSAIIIPPFIPESWMHGREPTIWAFAGVFSLLASYIMKRFGREVEHRGAPGA